MLTSDDMERFAATFLGEAVTHWHKFTNDSEHDECEICLLLIAVSISLRVSLSKVNQYIETMDAEMESRKVQ